jgi:transcription elongation GreA/GreB family factor
MSDVGLATSTPAVSLTPVALPTATLPAATLPPTSLPIAYGSTVEIEDLTSGHTTRYKLVHTYEANPRMGLLSEVSPVGKALLGRCAGERARVHTPRGLRELLIVAVA